MGNETRMLCEVVVSLPRVEFYKNEYCRICWEDDQENSLIYKMKKANGTRFVLVLLAVLLLKHRESFHALGSSILIHSTYFALQNSQQNHTY